MVRTERIEWWDTVEEALHDAQSHFDGLDRSDLLDELEHLYKVRERVLLIIEKCKRTILEVS